MKSIFIQKKYEKIWHFVHIGASFPWQPRTYNMEFVNGGLISTDIIAEYDIDMPLLEIDEEFYLHDLDKNVLIKKRMRSSENAVVYYVEDELIDTENTQKTYDKCLDVLNKYNEQEELICRMKKYMNNHKYKHRFFNFVKDDFVITKKKFDLKDLNDDDDLVYF